jgi:hypothetical protein
MGWFCQMMKNSHLSTQWHSSSRLHQACDPWAYCLSQLLTGAFLLDCKFNTLTKGGWHKHEHHHKWLHHKEVCCFHEVQRDMCSFSVIRRGWVVEVRACQWHQESQVLLLNPDSLGSRSNHNRLNFHRVGFFKHLNVVQRSVWKCIIQVTVIFCQWYACNFCGFDLR